jgi:cobalamin synthase
LIVGMVSRRKIGGVTGDVLGATCELAEVAMGVTAALLVGLK